MLLVADTVKRALKDSQAATWAAKEGQKEVRHAVFCAEPVILEEEPGLLRANTLAQQPNLQELYQQMLECTYGEQVDQPHLTLRRTESRYRWKIKQGRRGAILAVLKGEIILTNEKATAMRKLTELDVVRADRDEVLFAEIKADTTWALLRTAKGAKGRVCKKGPDCTRRVCGFIHEPGGGSGGEDEHW